MRGGGDSAGVEVHGKGAVPGDKGESVWRGNDPRGVDARMDGGEDGFDMSDGSAGEVLSIPKFQDPLCDLFAGDFLAVVAGWHRQAGTGR